MFDLFSNPGYLAAGAAAVSSPIIIHLINRMRFKRLRWAAMEFLLKSQKRNRRRLIIEQLILLLLRCLLIVMTALLVLRFVGFTFGGYVGQDGMHVILLDDTLSMSDKWFSQDEKGEEKTAFEVAKKEIILGAILKSVAQSSTNERIAIIPLSSLVKDKREPIEIFEQVGESSTKEEMTALLEEMKQSNLRVDLAKGVERAQELFGEHPEKRPILHIVSDFRRQDWSGAEGKGLNKLIKQMLERKVKIQAWDAAYKDRALDQSGVPGCNENVAIVDLRSSTRVGGRGMPVSFLVTVANYSNVEKEVNLVAYDQNTGAELAQVDFNPPMPFKIPPDGVATASFELTIFPDVGEDEFFMQRIAVKLESKQRTPLKDGVAADNVRYAGIEVRKKVPVLIVDGNGARGRKENNDSFFMENALLSVPGASYDVVFADELPREANRTVLESIDLSKYPTIFLLNVAEFTRDQKEKVGGGLKVGEITKLNKYVEQGGGLGIFLGPRVNGGFYTENLYKKGEGFFPVPLRETYEPPPGREELKPRYTGDFQLLIRDDEAKGKEPLPIFGAVFTSLAQREFLKDVPIRRFYPVPRSLWKKEPGKVFELATLPNDQLAWKAYQGAAIRLIARIPVNKEDYSDYQAGLQRHIGNIKAVVEPGTSYKAYHLAQILKNMLEDRGKEKNPKQYPDLTEFWSLPDLKIKSLKKEVEDLIDTALYGDPFVVAKQHGKGRVVAVMSTAGKEWNDWAGGSGGSFVFQPFVWEMQNWLSSLAAEATLLVGTKVTIEVDRDKYAEQGKNNLVIKRTYFKPQKEGPPTKVSMTGTPIFSLANPGYCETVLRNQGEMSPLASWGHIFNVDPKEGKLQRVSQDEFNRNVNSEESNVEIFGLQRGAVPELINKETDLSEHPAFFLIFLIILVCEQALAVHLSFHLRGNEAQMPQQAAPRRVAA